MTAQISGGALLGCTGTAFKHPVDDRFSRQSYLEGGAAIEFAGDIDVTAKVS